MASEDHNPFLPLDIINEILLKLPVKSILKCQNVCKEWKNLLKSPSFSAEYFSNNSFLLLHEYNDNDNNDDDDNDDDEEEDKEMFSSLRLLDHNMETVEFMSIPQMHYFTQHEWRIIDSCKGILFVEGNDYKSPTKRWLWNPMTRHVREIPNPMEGYWHAYNVGFGFSSAVNDYKVVRFFQQLVIQSGKVEVSYSVQMYSLSTGSWKKLQLGDLLKLENTILESLSKAVSNDGNIFWFAKDWLIVFDIASEVFTSSPIPADDRIYPIGLSVSENILAVHCRFKEEDGPDVINVWEKEEVSSESEKGLCFDQIYRIEQMGGYSSDTTILCIWGNEIVILDRNNVTEVEGWPRCVLNLFDLINNELRSFNCSNAFDRCDAFNFEKSLVSFPNT